MNWTAWTENVTATFGEMTPALNRFGFDVVPQFLDRILSSWVMVICLLVVVLFLIWYRRL